MVFRLRIKGQSLQCAATVDGQNLGRALLCHFSSLPVRGSSSVHHLQYTLMALFPSLGRE
jgi:hypothetical protein